MKNNLMLLFATWLISITTVSAINKADAYGNGWNDDGGGVGKNTKNNPWFIGNDPVFFCIDHGGEDHFSLSKEKAVNRIKETLNDFLADINKYKNTQAGDYLYRYFNDGHTHGLKGLTFNETEQTWGTIPDYATWEKNSGEKWLNTNFILDEECQENKQYDFQIVLGNVENPAIVNLRQSKGEAEFSQIIGYAFQTNYSLLTLRANGVIYFAADKGDHTYSGPRNKIYKRDDAASFWDNYEYFKDQIIDPADRSKYFPLLDKNSIDEGIYYADVFVGPFQSILLHELGHIFGFQHGANEIMSQDFPYDTAVIGLVPKSVYRASNSFLSKSLVNFIPTAIGFDATIFLFKVLKDSQNLPSKLLNNINKLFNDKIKDVRKQPGHIIFEIDRRSQGNILTKNHDQGTIRIKNLDYQKNRYEELVSYPFYYSDDQHCTQSTVLTGTKSGEVKLNFYDNPSNPIYMDSVDLITLKDEVICGEIKLSTFKSINFIVRMNHLLRPELTIDNTFTGYFDYLYNTEKPEQISPIVRMIWMGSTQKSLFDFLKVQASPPNKNNLPMKDSD